MGDFDVQVSVRLSIRSSVRQLFLWVSCERNSSYSIFTDIFETLHVFSLWCEDVHVVWI